MERLDRYLIGLVLAHFFLNLVHATAHFALQILPVVSTSHSSSVSF